MPLIFITGAPRSGKTSIVNEMQSRGLNIFDTDDQKRTGMSGWHNIETGKYIAGFNEVEVTKNMLATHIWKLTDEALKEFQNRSKKELIYLCGYLRDPDRIVEISQRITFLTLPREIIRERLIKRAKKCGEVNWGHEPWQIEHSIANNKKLKLKYKTLGATMINANQPLVQVVDDIIIATSL